MRFLFPFPALDVEIKFLTDAAFEFKTVLHHILTIHVNLFYFRGKSCPALRSFLGIGLEYICCEIICSSKTSSINTFK